MQLFTILHVTEKLAFQKKTFQTSIGLEGTVAAPALFGMAGIIRVRFPQYSGKLKLYTPKSLLVFA